MCSYGCLVNAGALFWLLNHEMFSHRTLPGWTERVRVARSEYPAAVLVANKSVIIQLALARGVWLGAKVADPGAFQCNTKPFVLVH